MLYIYNKTKNKPKNQIPEIVELDLANWSSATNLNATTTTQSNNTTHPSANITLNPSDLPGSPATANPTTTTTKREPYLRNWFLTSSSSSPSAATAQPHLTPLPTTPTTPIPIVNLPSANANDSKSDSVDITTPNQSPQQSVHPSVPSTHYHQTNNGESIDKVNNKASAAQPQQHQQKSSRRTTSLLNLFMSNSQGK